MRRLRRELLSSGGVLHFALLACYTGYRLTPAVPPGRAAPPATWVWPARPACVCGGEGAAGHSGNLPWARMMKPGFWFRFGRQAATQIQSTRPVTQTPRATVPLGAGQGTGGPGPGRSPGPGPAGQMRACLRWAGGSSREAGWPRTHTGRPSGQEQKADGVVTGGAARSRSQALAAALTRRPLGSRTAPQLPAWITHCRGRRQVPPSGL